MMTGMPFHVQMSPWAMTPALTAASYAACSMTPPLWSPRFMHAEHTPEMTATMMPFLKLNSATAYFFSSSGSSFSLIFPAKPTNMMPSSDPTTPARTMSLPVETAPLSP